MTRPNTELETLAAQAGIRGRSESWQSTTPAIYPSTTFTYDAVEDIHTALGPMGSGYAYSRNANPTVAALEECLAGLEGTEDAVAFASGMAAIHAVVFAAGLKPGDTIIAATDIYGVTRSLFSSFFNALGIRTRFVDLLDLGALSAALGESEVRAVYFEPISNPLLHVPDVAQVITLAQRAGALTIVDSTFASPYLMRPSDLGADFVVHSATKYLSGHGDVVAGLVASDRDACRWLRDVRTTTGAVLGPFEAWLTLRGIRTLPLRMRRHCENAERLAYWLQEQDAIDHVYYPGLCTDGERGRVTKQFRDGLGGGMVSFDLAPGGLAQEGAMSSHVEALIDALELAVPATSLGDVETLVLYPARTSHRTLSADERLATGIGDGLIRVSVGLEHCEDITADFAQALRSTVERTSRSLPQEERCEA